MLYDMGKEITSSSNKSLHIVQVPYSKMYNLMMAIMEAEKCSCLLCAIIS